MTLLDRESRYIEVRSDSLSHFAKRGEPQAPEWDASMVDHGFVYANGFFGNIDVPGSAGTEVICIKNNGRLLGAFFDQLKETHGFSAVR